MHTSHLTHSTTHRKWKRSSASSPVSMGRLERGVAKAEEGEGVAVEEVEGAEEVEGMRMGGKEGMLRLILFIFTIK